MRDVPRPVERWLARGDRRVACPRTRMPLSDCAGCAWFCRIDDATSSVICSFPVPARDTFTRRASRDEAVRIALSHRLRRT